MKTQDFIKRFVLGEFSVQRIIRSTLMIYLLVGVWAYFGTEGLIFRPPRPSTYSKTSDLLTFTTVDGLQITARYLPYPQAKYTILYSHGNAEDLGEIQSRLKNLRDLGFSILAYDYPGYGLSQGQPSEQGAYQAIDAAYQYLTQTLNVAPDQIIIYGRSVGSGPSVDLASRQPVGGLILESPFKTAFRVVTRIPIFPFDKFANLNKIQQVNCPILILHGRADEVIPFDHGEYLFNVADEPKLSFWIDGAGHNDLVEVAGDRYSEILQQFLQLLN